MLVHEENRPDRCYVLNFSASYSGGGYKRLYEFAKWFNVRGGAHFLIHQRCRNLAVEFPRNAYFVITSSWARRVIRDGAYLDAVLATTGRPDLYYSYGIPVYRKVAAVNWFHVSNVLPLRNVTVPLNLMDRAKANLLGARIRRTFVNADIVSVESKSSLELIEGVDAERLFVSVNGNDDELRHLAMTVEKTREAVVTAVGTYRYKCLDDAYLVFRMLQERGLASRLRIIGDRRHIPRRLLGNEDVDARGALGRPEVIEQLSASRFYVSTTCIENSYNAAAEGVFLAEESYISDIGPHRELLEGSLSDLVSISGMYRRMLHVRRSACSEKCLKTWDTVITEMLTRAEGTSAVASASTYAGAVTTRDLGLTGRC